MKIDYDVIVIGAGHAGCEAAHAAAKLGKRVLLTCTDIRTVGFLACNPSIGGVGKSHLVYEIDALGGLMGRIADKCCIQMRTLNHTNGPAVHALRAQVDRHAYHNTMLEIMQNAKNITLFECEVVKILTKDKKVCGIKTLCGQTFDASAVVIASGVYLDSVTSAGAIRKDEGPAGFTRSSHLTQSLKELGVPIKRFSTSTSPRLDANTIDYTKTTPQIGDTDTGFSFMTNNVTKNAVQCHLTYTDENTHNIIKKELNDLNAGTQPPGPRYCPSVEEKVLRFPNATRHQVFLEPESLGTNDVYLGGMTTGLSHKTQLEFVQSIRGLETSHITNMGYAIEYNCIDSMQLLPTLEHKYIGGLFFAGQVNGTSGYEEAAAQGIVAGINASGQTVLLSRTNSYIGVLIDDLVTMGTNEPYRMFTSRAEHRLRLRQDNADQRLTPIGREVGLVDDERWQAFSQKMDFIGKARQGKTVPENIKKIVEIEQLYSGYLAREEKKIQEILRCEKTLLPRDFDYFSINPLKREAQEKLNQIKPANIAQATRISGVSPADIEILMVWIKKYSGTQKS